MAYLCNANWVAQPGSGDVVHGLLRQLAEASRLERGNRGYEVFRDDAETFRIVEVYDDEQAFAAHLASSHFIRLAMESAIPLLASRSRTIQVTADQITEDQVAEDQVSADQQGAPS